MKINKIEYVFNNKDFLSKQRAEIRKKELIENGYVVLYENSKKTTFIKK